MGDAPRHGGGDLSPARVVSAFATAIETPLWLRRALRYVPAAVLTAIWAPEVAIADERLAAGVVAIAVAWRWRLTFATIFAGLAALHVFHWLI